MRKGRHGGTKEEGSSWSVERNRWRQRSGDGVAVIDPLLAQFAFCAARRSAAVALALSTGISPAFGLALPGFT